MEKYEIKARLKAVKKSTWVFLSIMTFFVVLAIVLILVAMHLSGYSLIAWLGKFGGWIILVLSVVLLLVLAFAFYKFRKGK